MKDEHLSFLDDYLRGGDVPEEYEEDLFARALAGSAPELAFRDGVGRTLRAMEERGTLDIWATKRQVERLVTSGRRVLRVELDIANPVAPDLSSDFDVLVTRIPLPLAGVDRLDVDIVGTDGRVLKRMPDIPFDAEDGAVYAVCEAELARTSMVSKTTARIWASESAGPRLLFELALP